VIIQIPEIQEVVAQAIILIQAVVQWVVLRILVEAAQAIIQIQEMQEVVAQAIILILAVVQWVVLRILAAVAQVIIQIPEKQEAVAQAIILIQEMGVPVAVAAARPVVAGIW
jgi:hypothetical protein